MTPVDAPLAASFIGFTGIPIESKDKSTETVFGQYIHTYPVAQAVDVSRQHPH